MSNALRVVIISGIISILGALVNINLMQDKTLLQNIGLIVVFVGCVGMGVGFQIARNTKNTL